MGKVYGSDLGLIHHLRGGDSPDGSLFENLVLTDLLAWRDASGERVEILYWRTAGQQEVDFVIEAASHPAIPAPEPDSRFRRPVDRTTPSCLSARMYIHSDERFEWDDEKAASNLRKHGVDFADAAAVLFDDFALTIFQEHREEERFATVGTDAVGRILVVVYTWRGERIRIISARKATRRERLQYENPR